MVAEGDTRNLFLCAEHSAPSDIEGFECYPDEHYSAYYGSPVFLCPGGFALPAM